MTAVQYYISLATTPSLVDSLELLLGQTATWKYYLYLRSLLYNRLQSILLSQDTLCAWRIERLLLMSEHLQVRQPRAQRLA